MIRKLLFLAATMVLSLYLQAQEVPAVYTNIGVDETGVYVQLGERRIYALPPKDQFQFTDLYGNAVGTPQGLDLDFKFPELNGRLYYGFINYEDGLYPQPVFFREEAIIEEGKAAIDIAGKLSGRYDMINWERKGKGVLGYRIVNSNGMFLFDGRLAFTYKEGKFRAVPTVIEGPMLNQLGSKGAVISFTTTKPVVASIEVGGKAFAERKESVLHEIRVDGLEPQTVYPYKLKVGAFEFTYYFETAPAPGSRSKFTFAYCSDSRSGKGGGERDLFGTNAYIMKRIAAQARAEGAKFVQFTGDLIDGYETSRERMNLQYANWKRAVEPFWHYIPFVPAMGNHEAYNYIFNDPDTRRTYMIDHFPFEDDSSESLFQDNFSLPTNGPISEDGSRYDINSKKRDFPPYEETVFWYGYDNVAIVVLNSDYWYAPSNHSVVGGNPHAYIMDRQMKWLGRTLKQLERSKAIDHIFVSIHTPFFPNGGHVQDDMWYNGNNSWRPTIAGQLYAKGIIERRDQLLDLIVNQSPKVVAVLTGDEHNYNLLTMTNEVERYPENYPHQKLELSRPFYQINNGAAGAPYYAQEVTPWMEHLRKFSTQNALVLIDVDGSRVHVRVKNPDTLELIDEYTLRE